MAVTRKESQEMMRNWMSLLLTIIAPIILYFLFGYGMSLDVKNIPFAVLDEDKTQESRKFISTFSNAKIFEIKKIITRFEEIDDTLRRGEIRAVLVIPPRFAEKIQQAVPQKVLVYVDSMYTSRAQMTGGYIEGTIASYNQEVTNNFFRRKFGQSHGQGSGMPVDIYISPWFNPSFRSEDFIIPGVIGIILVFLPPTIASIALSKEKETGSILNMFCSPITKFEYIIGKSLPYIVITYFNFILFLIFSVTIFKVPLRGDLITLLLVSLLYVIVVIGMGIAVAVIVNSQIAAILITSILNMIPSFMYSGFLLPIICMDPSGKETAYSIPPTYYIDFARKLMIKGEGLEYLKNDIIVLALMAVGLYTFSILAFRKRLG